MAIQIRRAEYTDYPGLCALFDELDEWHRIALPHIYRRLAGPARSEDYIRELLGDEDGLVLVAEEKQGEHGQLLGLLNAQLLQAQPLPILVPRCFVRIENIAVREDARRRGIGTAMMMAARDWALKRGAHDVELGVWEFNAGARAFYESLGYETATRRMWLHLK